jgi:DNA primase
MSCLNQFIKNCHKTLVERESDEAHKANLYLSNRGVTYESIRAHNIGYCPINSNIPNEVAYYGKKEINEGDYGYSYFMQGRIIVPVYSEFDRVVGLATRKPTTQPGNTWWNLPKPFHKGNYLFLLNKVRKKVFDTNKIYLVEGYMDAILLYQEGLDNVVALMGTVLSPRKIGLIARYCNNICLCLDVDENESGQKGQEKAIYALKEADFCESISIIADLPVGEDPDVFVKKNGLNALLEREKKLSTFDINNIYNKVRIQNKNR